MNDDLFPRETQAVVSIASLYILRMLGLFMLLPVLALYAGDFSGSTPFMVGLALGAYGLTQGLLQIPFGLLSDRIGRKPVIAVGLLIFAAGSVLAALSTSIYGVILGRFLQGGGAIASTLMAFVADLTSEQNRTKAMAAIGGSIGVSFAISLVLGPMLSSYGGIQAIFWATALLSVMGLGILFFFVPPAPEVEYTSREVRAVPSLLGEALKNRQLLRLDLGIFTLHFSLMCLFQILPLLLRDVAHMGTSHHWQAYLPLMFFSFVAMVPLVIVAEKHKKIKPVFLFAILLLAASLLLLSQELVNSWVMFALLFGFFMAFNLLEALLPSLVSKTAPAGSRGTAMGVYSSSQFFGAFWGGAAGGWVLQHYGMPVLLQCAAVLVLCWFVAARKMKRPKALKNLSVKLPSVSEQTLAQLKALPGVHDVALIRKYSRAYLKIDDSQFDAAQLDKLNVGHE